MKTIVLPNDLLLPKVIEMITEGKQVTLKAKGNSMMPFIVGERDSVILKRQENYYCNDIVLASVLQNQFVLHRIINIENDKIILMGDGNLEGTEICRRDDIHGRVTAIVHKGHKINCNSKSQQLKVYIWLRLLPIRRYLLAIYRRII